MATPREQFARQASGAVTATAIPDFPKLPEFLRKMARTDDEKKQLEQYEGEVEEYFKKRVVRGL
jgi:hypothetical protein